MALTSPLLNSAREIKLKFSRRPVRPPLLMRLLLEDIDKKKRVPDAIQRYRFASFRTARTVHHAECRRRPLKHGKPMIDVPVTKGMTVFRAATARRMTEPATKLSSEMPVVAKTGSISNLAESLTGVEGGPALQKTRGVI